MFMKYNAKLRQFPAAAVAALKNNGYVTTIHAVVSAIIKLSRTWKIPFDRKVYRGLGGMLLPQKFWGEDAFGCRGGVELGIMSTTTTREVAIQYSGTEKGRPTIFEIEVGQVDRGAPLRWVSQYPGEDEIVMPPLSNLEVVGDARMEDTHKGVIMVIPLRINVNLKSLTMDELQGRRKLLHISMMQNLLAEAHRDLTDIDKEAEASEEANKKRIKLKTVAKMLKGTLAQAFEAWRQRSVDFKNEVRKKLTVQEVLQEKEKMLDEFKELVSEMCCKDGEWFNDDSHYKDAMTWSLDTKRGIIRKYREILSDRFKRFLPDVKARILMSKCILWAREGTVYRIISNTRHFPWHAVAEGKVAEVMLRPDLNNDQAQLAWEAIEDNYMRYGQTEHGIETEGFVVEHVALRGLAGKTVKLEVGETLMGQSLCMQMEQVGKDGEAKQEVQGLGQESIRLLLPALRRNRNLTKLDLARSIVGPELAKDLAAILRRVNGNNFSSLHIRGNIPLGKARTAHEFSLNRGHAAHINLLQRPRPDASPLNSASDSLGGRANSVLRASSVRNGFVRDWEPCDVEGGIAIATFLQENNTLRKLDLEGNCISAEGATALAGVLSGLTSLTYLNLRDNNIGERGATALSQALQAHRSLVELDLRDNRMGAQGLASLVPAIEANTALVTLNNLKIEQAGFSSGGMRVRHMTDPGYEMVFVHLRLRDHLRAHELTYLDLSENSLGFEGARLLYTALLGCQNLEELDIRSNALRSAGVAIVANAFPELGRLTSLDLSFNLIDTYDANLEVAAALKKLPNLATLEYLGNIEAGISFPICCPGAYHELNKSLPNVHITMQTPAQARMGILTWVLVIGCIVLFFGLSITSIYLYNALSYNQLGWAMFVGSIAILVVVGVFLLIWVLYRRLFARLGITHYLARALYSRREATSPRRRRLSTRPLEEHDDSEEFSDELSVAFEGLSEGEREAAKRILKADDTPSGLRCTSLRNRDSTAYEEDEKAAAMVEPDEAFEFVMKLDPKIARKVPMLLEQYLLRTAVPGTLDIDMWKTHSDMLRDFAVHSFFHSYSPLTLALRKPIVHVMLVVIVAYYCVISGLMLVPWYTETEALPLSSYRLVVTKRINGSDFSSDLGQEQLVKSFELTGDNLFSKVQLMDHLSAHYVAGNTWVLEFDTKVKMRHWHLEFWGKDEKTPRDFGSLPGHFKLEGCPGTNCTINARTHEKRWLLLGTVEQGPTWVPSRVEHMVVKELLTTWILRFVPVVFAFGFFALLCCAYMKSYRAGRWIVVIMCLCNMLLYTISGFETRGGGLDYVAPTRRWFSVFPLCIWPMMMMLSERYLIHGILVSALIVPGSIVLCRHTYSPDLLPQFDTSDMSIVNYDQFSVFPVLSLVWVVTFGMLLRYAAYRAHAKAQVLGDEIELNALWETIKLSSFEALVDVKREMDKFRRIQQLQESQRNSLSSRGGGDGSRDVAGNQDVFQRIGLKINDVRARVPECASCAQCADADEDDMLAVSVRRWAR